MIFTPTALAGVFVVEVERLSDERGFFARTYCADELRDGGLELPVAQCSISEMTDDPDPSARPVTVIPSPAMRHISAL